MESGLPVAVGGLGALGAQVAPGKVALIFGREANGLLSSELLMCTHQCEIATSAVQGSLSLPAAANLALGRAFEEALALESAQAGQRPLGGGQTSPRASLLSGPAAAADAPRHALRSPLATIGEMELAMRRWSELAESEAGGGAWVRTARGARAASSHGRATALLRRMLQRAQPTTRELRALHGALAALEQGAGVQRTPGEA
jgi:hypothetical protein